jgi:hypothetical protein
VALGVVRSRSFYGTASIPEFPAHSIQGNWSPFPKLAAPAIVMFDPGRVFFNHIACTPMKTG